MRIGAPGRAGIARLVYLLSVLGLVAALVIPAAATAQFKDDDRPEDEATEEATDDSEEPEDEEEGSSTGDPSDWEDAGLISDTEYESPQFGYAVEWSSDWEIDLYYDQPEEDMSPVVSNEDEEYDTLYLAWFGDPDAATWAIVTGQTANRGGLDEEIDEWTDEDWMADQWAETIEAEVLLTDTSRDTAGVVYRLEDTEEGYVYYTVYVAVYLDDYTYYLSFTSFEDFMEDGYAALEEIEIDGDPLFVFFDWNDIEAEM